MDHSSSTAPPGRLTREIGLVGATMMGLGSILGTGVFVSVALASGVTGPSVVLAIALAGVVATLNGLSSAQLAANHPMSGGTYEYGYRWLHPALGFIAGWMFLCAKTASAATAALGFSGYALHALGLPLGAGLVPLALASVVAMTVLVLVGIRRSNQANIAIVSVTIFALLAFVIAGSPWALANGGKHFLPFFTPISGQGSPSAGFLEASVLMFVAYTGYGRIATLAEEVRTPHRTIPIAIVVTLVISMLLYIAVATVGIGAVGAPKFAAVGVGQAAPLEVTARQFGHPIWSRVIAVGAVTAMLSVLLNLILGLSRVVFAMGRRGDLPRNFAESTDETAIPRKAVLLVSGLICGLVLVGNVKTTWSFSAFTVLVYYAITNLAATRLSPTERFVPSSIAWFGLIFCLFLAFWVEAWIWQIGLALIAVGYLWHWVARTYRRSRSEPDDRE